MLLQQKSEKPTKIKSIPASHITVNKQSSRSKISQNHNFI